METVGITGATGTVGAALARHLVESNMRVRALSRSTRADETLASQGVEPVRGDLLNAQSLARLVKGCRWVFNVAGVNQMCTRNPAAMEAANVDGVRMLMSACRRQGVERLVHTSSAVTLGESRGTIGSEESPHRGSFLSEYERTKYEGERVLFEECDGLDVVAVNPSSVQGPGRATGTGKVILDVLNGDLRFLVDSNVSLVDIDDCARGHLLAAAKGVAGERYVLSGATETVSALVALASDVTGNEISPRVLPGYLVAGAVAIAEPLARLARKEVSFCREMVRVMRFGHHYDGRKATVELGLVYTGIEDTLRRTADWFASEGLLRGQITT